MAVADNLPRLVDAQARASAPDGHVWLSASAGTGKTHVLAARVFRLLLRGADPSAILALTFTKAGAAEMARRISARLAAWVQMDDHRLGRDLAALGESAGPETRALARTLFARLLDARGGGVRIQTIHGFCQSLLASFPIEAGLTPGFRAIEGREQAVLARETLAAMLVEAEARSPAMIDSIGALSMRLGEGKAEAFLAECARAHGALDALPTGIAPFLRGAFGLPLGDVGEAIAARCADDAFDIAGLRALAAMNAAWNTAKGLARADTIAAWIARAPDARAATLADLHGVWARDDGALRSLAKGQAPQEEGYGTLVERFHARCGALIAIKARAAYADLLARGLEAGRAYADAYSRAKRRAGRADFDDLIRAAGDLLDQPGMGEWVRYKLDLATEHILVDEAQDTNARQWRIVRAIADEFFAGQGTSGRMRTLFVVGDFKQAIFGFQGTDPIYFAAAERHFATLAQAGTEAAEDGEAAPFHRLSLTHSFRSTRPILEFVDAAVAGLEAPGLGLVEDIAAHASEVKGPGQVTLWPPVIEGSGEADEEGWADEAERALAAKIAGAVKAWLDPADPLMLESAPHRRPLRAGDVMILVKRRRELASLLVARLFAAGVPVAGVDRLRLNAPLAVRDLLVAIRFALQPEDDLSLAALLTSPILGWSHEDLLAAAVPRETSLWRHLRATQDSGQLAPIADLLARADFQTPHQLLEHLLSGPLDARRKLLRRLGAEARDPIEELLSAALDFENRATPSLQAFLDWFDRGEVDIARDPDSAGDSVRVMTAHGAKGLQAPIVILADACIDPARSAASLLRWTPEGGEDPLPLFAPRKEERSGPIEAIAAAEAERELQEHWRLFYVAATRAEERLVIAGALGARARGVPPANSWYSAAERAMQVLGVPPGEGAREFHGSTPTERFTPLAARASRAAPPMPLPNWVRASAPAEARPPRPLAPSSLGEDAVSDPPPDAVARAAAERGRLTHALFERLPPVAPGRRAEAADRWLARAGGLNDAGARAAIIANVLRVLDDARFAPLFGAEALAEAPIAAVLGNGLVVSGKVDRLLIEPERVRIIDFKTGRRLPKALDAIPSYHLRQMAAYAAALGVIFPEKAVEAALLYAAGPVLFALPEALLAQHKPGFVADEQSFARDA